MRSTAWIRLLPSTLVACIVLSLASRASAETATGRDPDRHPHYFFEAEPHALVGLFEPQAFGAGFRGTFVLSDAGFIRNVNDTVGLGVGFDWTHDTTWVPVVLQWNFWVSEHWSVFGEPGVAFRWRDHYDELRPDLTLYGGARWLFAPRASLTMRIGYPAFAVGVSFLL
jgi:hypothetical protein